MRPQTSANAPKPASKANITQTSTRRNATGETEKTKPLEAFLFLSPEGVKGNEGWSGCKKEMRKHGFRTGGRPRYQVRKDTIVEPNPAQPERGVAGRKGGSKEKKKRSQKLSPAVVGW